MSSLWSCLRGYPPERAFPVTNNIKRKCLNCGYERQPDEESKFNPASECPKCHAIYEKVEKWHSEKERKTRLFQEEQQSRHEKEKIISDEYDGYINNKNYKAGAMSYEKFKKVYEERFLKEQQRSREETITDRNPSPVSVFSILLPVAYFFKTIYPLHGVIDTICNVLLLLIFVGCVIMMIYRIQSEGFWHFMKSIFLDYVNIIESVKQYFKGKNERSWANAFFNELMRNRGLRNASTNRSGRRRKR